MVSLKIQLLATVLLISEAYSQQFPCCPQRCGTTTASSTGPIIPGGQFVIPAKITPLIPSQSCYPKQTCYDDDDDCELDKLLCLLMCNIIENRKCYGKKGSSSVYCDSSSACDAYDCYVSGYGDDDDTGYTTAVCYGSGKDSGYTIPSCDNTCPEICVYLKPSSNC